MTTHKLAVLFTLTICLFSSACEVNAQGIGYIFKPDKLVKDAGNRIGDGRQGSILFHTPAPQTSTLPMLDYDPKRNSPKKAQNAPKTWITPNGDVYREGLYSPEKLGRAQPRQIGTNIYWVYGNQKQFIETVAQAQQRKIQHQQQQQRMRQQQMLQQQMHMQQQLNQQHLNSMQQSINNAFQQLQNRQQYRR